MRTIAAVFSVLSLLLGGLWFLQGIGIVRIRPLLCFADCEPVQGPSIGWVIAGLFLCLGGAIGIFFLLKRPKNTP